MDQQRRRITLAIGAMGGQGGGVLSDWIVDTAERNGYLAQATSVPGVAQRTGATIYYIELFPADEAEQQPIFALMAVPGDVDVVIAAELLEAGRAVQRGLVTPDRTTLIASSHRAYAVAEKSALGDGRSSSEETIAVLETAARRFVCADMQDIAEQHNTVISASLFGALAGSEALPFSREQFEAAVRASRKSIDENLAAFAAGFALAQNREEPSATAPTTQPLVWPKSKDAAITALLNRAERSFEPQLHSVLIDALRRLVDYQDCAYAELYLDRLSKLFANSQSVDHGVFRESVARHLALWMSYEDSIRVADLKIRSERFARCRDEVFAEADEIVQLTEFLHPRVEELADSLPQGLGAWLMRSRTTRAFLERWVLRERKINTSSIRGFLLFYALAGLRRYRRKSYRFGIEQQRIEQWLTQISNYLKDDVELAQEFALCQNLIKGYGDTHARGLKHFNMIAQAIEKPNGDRLAAGAVAQLRAAALADEQGLELQNALAGLG